MKCPECNTELDRVIITSECWQHADIDETGNVTDYSEIKAIGDTQAITCPKCDHELSDLIKELP